MIWKRMGQIRQFNKLTDHQQLQIYAGGGADYAVAEEFLKHRRDEAKRFHGRDLRGYWHRAQRQSSSLSVCREDGSQA